MFTAHVGEITINKLLLDKYPNIEVNRPTTAILNYIDYTVDATLKGILGSKLNVNDHFLCNTAIIGSPNICNGISRAYKEWTAPENYSNSYYNLYFLIFENSNLFEKFKKENPIQSPVSEIKEAALFFEKKLNRKAEIRISYNAAFVLLCKDISGDVLSIVHSAQAFLQKMYPDIFKNKPLTAVEKQYLRSLAGTNTEGYLNCLEHLYNNIPEIKMESLLNAVKIVCSNRYEKQIKATEDALNASYASQRRMLEDYQNLLDSIETQSLMLESLKQKQSKQDGNESLCEYIAHNKAIVKFIPSTNNNNPCIVMTVKGYLENFDPEVYQHVRGKDTDNTFLNYTLLQGETAKRARLLCDALFNEEPKLKLGLCGMYHIEPERNKVYSRNSFGAIEADGQTWIDNPHLSIHQCLGSHAMEISNNLAKGNIEGAIEQCISSCKSVNIAETSMTFAPMIADLMHRHYTKKCILRNDGAVLSPKEAIEWLRKENFNDQDR